MPTFDFSFLGAITLAVGALITFLDGAARYNTRDRLGLSGGGAEGVDIPPRYFTSERGYSFSVACYLFFMELIYFVPAVGVPIALHSGAETAFDSALSTNAVAQLQLLGGAVPFPIVWSLLLVGALRYVPWINNIEPAIRRMCHYFADIPHYVHQLSRTLYNVDMKVEIAFPEGYRSDLPFVAAKDFNAAAASEEHAWARLSYLMRELEEMYTELGNLPAVHFGSRYAEEYENAAAEYRSLTYRMARHVDEKNGAAPSGALGADHRFKPDLRRAFARVSLLLVVLLNLRYRTEEQISARLQALGFNTALDPRRAEAGPDAAVTVLALALVLFFATPLTLAGVDVGLREWIGGGWLASGPQHELRYAGVIEYPGTVLREDQASLLVRVLLLFVMSFVTLLALAIVNLTIARRFGGIDPREMFSGQWLRRPYAKYFRASTLSSVLVLGTGVAMMFGLVALGQGDRLPTRVDSPAILIWLAPMFFIALPLHVFAQSKGQSLPQVLFEGLISGVIWASVCFVAALLYYTVIGEIAPGEPISSPQTLGVALYFGVLGLVMGTTFMTALLFVSKSARAMEERTRTPLMVVEGGRQAA